MRKPQSRAKRRGPKRQKKVKGERTMGKLQFLLRCVKDMDYAELFRTVGKVHKLTGKNSAAS